jgi:hypothetical protein
MTFVRQTGHLRDRCTVCVCFHARSCAQPDWNVNSNPDFDDVPVDTIIVIGCLRAMPSGPCRSVSDPLRQNEPNCRSNGGNSSSE